LRFTETMRGWLAPDPALDVEALLPVSAAAGIAARPAAAVDMSFTLTIASDDLNALLTDARHPARIVGTVSCAMLSDRPLDVTGGTFNLFTDDPSRVDRRNMVYRMALHAEDGRSYFFHGVKNVDNDPPTEAWRQTTTLYVTVREGGDDETGAIVGRGILYIELPDFLTQLRTIEITGASSPAERLKALASFTDYFAGVMADAYGGVFAKQKIFNPDAPPRLKRTLRAPAPEVYPFKTSDGVGLRLTRYRGGDKGPVVLLHGAGVSSGIFSTDLIETNLLEYLIAHQYDCWLLDYRASIDLPSAQVNANADQVATIDHPEAIALVRKLSGAPDVQVVAHCYGATTFTMALLAGLQGVRSAVLSQVSTHLKVKTLGEIKAGLHLPDVLAKLGVGSMTAYADTHEIWAQHLLDDALRLYPIKHGEECRSAVCHRISFMYALLYDHAKLSPRLHDNLHELFGVTSIETFEHLGRMARVGHVVSYDGQDSYLPHLDRMAIPIAFIHGGDNQCFVPESTQITYDLLRTTNPPNLYTRTVIDGYGHIDCIFGRDAAADVYPHFLEHLEKTA
jgi:cholesterol oxidase